MSYKTVAEEFLGDHFMVCENLRIEIPGNCLFKVFLVKCLSWITYKISIIILTRAFLQSMAFGIVQ